jgi:hypothetical protein
MPSDHNFVRIYLLPRMTNVLSIQVIFTEVQKFHIMQSIPATCRCLSSVSYLHYQCIVSYFTTVTIRSYLVSPQAPHKLILHSDRAYLATTKLDWNSYFFWIEKTADKTLDPIDASCIRRCNHLCKQSTRQRARQCVGICLKWLRRSTNIIVILVMT